MVRRHRIQRLLPLPLRHRHKPPMQILHRRHNPLVHGDRSHLMDFRLSLSFRPRLPPLPCRRALQRKPLHRLSSPPLPNPLPALRHARPFAPYHPPRPHLAPRRSSASRNARNPPSPLAARFPLRPPFFHSSLPRRRTHPRRLRNTST